MIARIGYTDANETGIERLPGNIKRISNTTGSFGNSF